MAATTMNGMQHMTSPAPFVREPDQEARLSSSFRNDLYIDRCILPIFDPIYKKIVEWNLIRYLFQIGISKPTGFSSSEAPQQLVEKLAATERENQALLIRLRQLEAFSKPAESVKDPRLEGLLEKISELEGRLRKKHPKGKPDEPEGDDFEGSSECDDES